MDFIDRLREISAKIPKLKQEGLIKTEEGTKNALVMPFINALGYNVFDPLEVTPELTADVGVKKGEKVDYAIMLDGKPIILFECKSVGTDLSQVHASQLYRYFSVTEARFGILTDGVVYKFFTDLDEPNKMDSAPFLVFDMQNIKEPLVDALKRFTKASFDASSIISVASELKYKNTIKTYLEAQLETPSDPFVRFFLQESHAFPGRLTQNVIEDFKPIMKEVLRIFINDQVERRLKSALASEPPAAPKAEEPETVAVEAADALIVTTQDEVDAYFVVKSIVREVIDVKRVTMRDAQSYCSVLVDDSNRRPICRIRFNTAQKYLGVMDEQRNEEKVPVGSVDDIYHYADRLRATAAYYAARGAQAQKEAE